MSKKSVFSDAHFMLGADLNNGRKKARVRKYKRKGYTLKTLS